MAKNVALIVAAGRGTRASRYEDEAPKQYVHLQGKPVLHHVIQRFLETEQIDHVLTVIHADDEQAYEQATSNIDSERLLAPVFGGATRQQSVYAGLAALESHQPQKVLIHDGARPFCSSDLISQVCNGLNQHTAILPALPVSDTLKRVEHNIVSQTLDRSNLWGAQTPQGFLFSDIWSAHKKAKESEKDDFTDDASIAEWFGLDVHVINAETDNFKITTKDDFEKGERLLNKGVNMRIGNGFDVHEFEPGDEIILCGISIPFDKKLKGHSDADVGLHAITDAIYGALGEGDIGQHFPPGDPQWKGAASDVFLKHAVELVTKRGGKVANIDLTLICEAPKIGPHSLAMRQFIANTMSLEIDQVSVKATTSEGLGFTGRREGIAALASALLLL